MAESKTRNEILAAAFDEMAPNIADGVTSMCTGYAVVAQWSDLDGNVWMTTNAPTNQAQWLTRGLLAEALSDLGKMEEV